MTSHDAETDFKLIIIGAEEEWPYSQPGPGFHYRTFPHIPGQTLWIYWYGRANRGLCGKNWGSKKQFRIQGAFIYNQWKMLQDQDGLHHWLRPSSSHVRWVGACPALPAHISTSLAQLYTCPPAMIAPTTSVPVWWLTLKIQDDDDDDTFNFK